MTFNIFTHYQHSKTLEHGQNYFIHNAKISNRLQIMSKLKFKQTANYNYQILNAKEIKILRLLSESLKKCTYLHLKNIR